jgi:hypothetical protein
MDMRRGRSEVGNPRPRRGPCRTVHTPELNGGLDDVGGREVMVEERAVGRGGKSGCLANLRVNQPHLPSPP